MWEDAKRRISYHETLEEKLKAIERGKRLREILNFGEGKD